MKSIVIWVLVTVGLAVGAAFLAFLVYLFGWLGGPLPDMYAANHNRSAEPQVLDSIRCGEVTVSRAVESTALVSDAGGFQNVSIVDRMDKTLITTPEGVVNFSLYPGYVFIEGEGATGHTEWSFPAIPESVSDTELHNSISFLPGYTMADLPPHFYKYDVKESDPEIDWDAPGMAFIRLAPDFITQQQFAALASCSGIERMFDLDSTSFDKAVFLYRGDN